MALPSLRGFRNPRGGHGAPLWAISCQHFLSVVAIPAKFVRLSEGARRISSICTCSAAERHAGKEQREGSHLFRCVAPQQTATARHSGLLSFPGSSMHECAVLLSGPSGRGYAASGVPILPVRVSIKAQGLSQAQTRSHSYQPPSDPPSSFCHSRGRIQASDQHEIHTSTDT